MKTLLQNAVLLLISGLLSLLAAEGALRLVFEPRDYIFPDLVEHADLGWVIAPGSAGHDAWGLRNPEGIEQADIVAIGDSQTYGFSARSHESWPAQLAYQTGRSVYNMGLGGYGPQQYQWFLEHEVSDLKPEIVVIGLYLGNDLFDAYRRSAAYREDEAPRMGLGRNSKDKRFGALRDWLASHSLLYQMAKPALKNALHAFLPSEKTPACTGKTEECLAALSDPLTADWLPAPMQFTPLARYKALNLKDPAIATGLEETRRRLTEIKQICLQKGLSCAILLIPTKEAVYRTSLMEGAKGAALARLKQQAEAEDTVREALLVYMAETGITVIDPLAEMRREAVSTLLYPQTPNGHPTAEGYRIMARATAAWIEKLHNAK